jgi:hypothetical protein
LPTACNQPPPLPDDSTPPQRTSPAPHRPNNASHQRQRQNSHPDLLFAGPDVRLTFLVMLGPRSLIPVIRRWRGRMQVVPGSNAYGDSTLTGIHCADCMLRPPDAEWPHDIPPTKVEAYNSFRALRVQTCCQLFHMVYPLWRCRGVGRQVTLKSRSHLQHGPQICSHQHQPIQHASRPSFSPFLDHLA